MPPLPPPPIVCAAKAVYREARGAPTDDQYHVGELVWGRAKDKHISPCKVIAMKGQFPWYGKEGPIKEKDKWEKALKVAYNTRFSDSPIRYNVTTSFHDKYERKRVWYNRMHPHDPIPSSIRVIYKDRYLTFYARTDDPYWRPYR